MAKKEPEALNVFWLWLFKIQRLVVRFSTKQWQKKTEGIKDGYFMFKCSNISCSKSIAQLAKLEC
jgi:hypothetical protein